MWRARRYSVEGRGHGWNGWNIVVNCGCLIGYEAVPSAIRALVQVWVGVASSVSRVGFWIKDVCKGGSSLFVREKGPWDNRRVFSVFSSEASSIAPV